MNELTFKDSMSTCHKIVTDANGKRYIMDTSTLTPNVHGFGIIPKQVTWRWWSLEIVIRILNLRLTRHLSF